MQDRVEGAALLEAAELRGDDSDAELDDSDVDSEIELEDSAAKSDLESDVVDNVQDAEGPHHITDPDSLDQLGVRDDDSDAAESEQDFEADDSELAEEEGVGGPSAVGSSAASEIDSEHSAEEDEDAEPSPGEHARHGSRLGNLDSDAEEDDVDHAPSIAYSDGEERERVAEEDQQAGRKKDSKPKLQPAADSLQTLKRKLAAAEGAKALGDGNDGEAGVPIEWGRVLTAEDFERIKELRHRSAAQHLCLEYLQVLMVVA